MGRYDCARRRGYTTVGPTEGKELSLAHANHQEKCIMLENQITEMTCGLGSPGGGERAGEHWGHKRSLVPRYQMESRGSGCATGY